MPTARAIKASILLVSLLASCCAWLVFSPLLVASSPRRDAVGPDGAPPAASPACPAPPACPACAAEAVHVTAAEAVHTAEAVLFVPTPIRWNNRRADVGAQFRREGWHLNRSKVVLLFVLGTRAGEKMEEALDTSVVVREEGAEYLFTGCRDMGDQPDSTDETSSMTCKVYEALRHVARHYRAQYVWRGSDDGYVNLKQFFKVKHTLPAARLYMGLVRWSQGATDLELSRQPRLKELFFGLEKFGPYMSGGSYLLSWDVAEFIGTFKIPPHTTWCEDVMVGMWLLPYQITWVNDHRFYHDGPAEQKWNNDPGLLAVHHLHANDWAFIARHVQ